MRLGRIKKVHFTGIGGIGMSGIAEVLLNMGYNVTGSDLQLSELTEKLVEMGATIHKGHDAEFVSDADVLIYSSAVTPENAEVKRAQEMKIPVIKRAEMLGELMRMKNGIAISGTHGKTTTTSLAGAVLTEGALDPTLIIGGRVRALDTNAKLGRGEILVAEADEYDRSFLSMTPTIAVITNIEAEHLDCYADLADLQDAFVEFANKVPFYGKVIACLDSPAVQEILHRCKRTVMTYGFSTQADVSARNLRSDGTNMIFDCYHEHELLGEITLQLPGHHNASNALAAICVGLELDVPFDVISRALREFSGINRRFEIKGNKNGIMIVDDYAHHPTEVAATLEGARNAWPEKKITAVFQPHLYSRTETFYREFAQSFFQADSLIVTGIYPAREQPIEGVTGEMVSNAATEMGHKDVQFVADMMEIPDMIYPQLQSEDMVVLLGAGDIWKCANELARRINAGN